MFRFTSCSPLARPLVRPSLPSLHVAGRQPCPKLTSPLRLAPVRRVSSSAPRRDRRYVRFGASGPGRGFTPATVFDVRTWSWGERIVVGVLLGGIAYYVGHLEKTPVTGRWRFMDVSPKLEAALAEANRQQLRAAFHDKILPPHHPVVRHVRRVVARILEANRLGTLDDDARPHRALVPDDAWMPEDDAAHGLGTGVGAGHARQKEWTLVVVNDDKIVNAAVSFGTIMVFTGILPVMQDEQGLAAVLGHEIGHEVLRHSEEKVSSAKVLLALVTLLDLLGFGGILSTLTITYFLDLPNSRIQEYEADMIGLRLAARACYDPDAAPKVFRRLQQVEEKMGGPKLDFFSTHPGTDKRIKVMQDLIPEAYAIRASNPECAHTADAFAAFRDSMGSMLVDRGLPRDGWRFA
ncbi:hypothetical protein OBBRIDRAFT_791378 [Obba rivulosa]|uniref:Peptidase M48 domain-containing protein n=1 Tax=Obba rivulosa TaxID=1052685 RepID=A0A8E2B0B4_9APHY|nr:hypothetical protein OBBRIDRAFT_791378 [Obba rivulosa]